MAYCAGTGGSILIIGSAAGVAAMGIEKIEFLWYMRRIAWLASGCLRRAIQAGSLIGLGVCLVGNRPIRSHDPAIRPMRRSD